MLLSQAIVSAATVGIGCGAGCGSSASAFLTTYVLSEGKSMRYAMSQVAAFYIGKMLAVVTVCMTGALLGQAFIGENGDLAGFSSPETGIHGHGCNRSVAFADLGQRAQGL